MTKAAALQQFFEGFGIPAYPSSSVPEDAAFPWLTYDLVTGSWETGGASITVNTWHYSTGEAEANAKAQEISEAIGYGGILLECDGGSIWLKRGSPWCQSLTDDADKMVKRRYLNVTAEFLTLN